MFISDKKKQFFTGNRKETVLNWPKFVGKKNISPQKKMTYPQKTTYIRLLRKLFLEGKIPIELLEDLLIREDQSFN